MPYGEEDAYKAQDILGGVGKFKAPFGEDATQPSSFKMRSGNATPFKLMGSSPFKWPKWLGGKGKPDAAAPQPKVAEATQSAKTMMEQQQGGGGGNVPPHVHDESGGIQAAAGGGVQVADASGFGEGGPMGAFTAQGGAQQKAGWGGFGAAQNTPEEDIQMGNPFDTQQSRSSLAGIV